LFEIWFDGGADHPDNGAPDVLPIIQRYQPNCLFYHNSQLAEARWGGSETGTVSYPCWATFPNFYSHAGDTPEEKMELLKHGDPSGAYWMPAMSDAPLRGYDGRHEWFWEPGDEDHIFPLENLMDMYRKSVGRNSTLIMGLTPDPDGLLPEPDVQRLQEWGATIRNTFSHPVATTSGKGKLFELDFGGIQKISHIIIQEDITQGERIWEYEIQALVQGEWELLCKGLSVGHKRIEQVEGVACSRLRLRVLEAREEPVLSAFTAYE